MKLFISFLAICLFTASAYTQSKFHYPSDFPDRGREVLIEKYADATISKITSGVLRKVGEVFFVKGSIGSKELELTLTKEGEVHEDLRVSALALDDVPEISMVAALKETDGVGFNTAELIERGDAIEYRLKGVVFSMPDGHNIKTHVIVLVSPEGEVLQSMRAHGVGG